MRNMSFALTKRQIRDGSKWVTRRDGWLKAKAGDLLRPVDKTMGFKKGERPRPLLPDRQCLRVVSVRREPLEVITPEDVIAEGFPEMTPAEFVAMYRKHGDKADDGKVSRIEFKYLQVLTMKELDELLEYSDSFPTGTAIGKRWKRKSGSDWIVGQYVDIGNPVEVGIRWFWAVDENHQPYRSR